MKKFVDRITCVVFIFLCLFSTAYSQTLFPGPGSPESSAVLPSFNAPILQPTWMQSYHSFLDTLDRSNVTPLTSWREPAAYKVSRETEYLFYKPRPLQFLTNAPFDTWSYVRNTMKWENLPMIGLVLASTAIMVYYDQEILDATQRFGRSIGLKGTNNQKTYFTILGQPIQFPHDTDTWLYFIGDGWTHISIGAGFLTYGLIKSDNRALQTASQLAEGMVVLGLTTQFLKHITGRESPFVATRPGGRWIPFPDQVEYHKHVPNYDAYPSGHLATGMMTVTVIAENYPEKKWIRPLGYTLLALLSFEMVNNGVHWVSDYPLSIVMGYGFAKLLTEKNRWVRHSTPELTAKGSWKDRMMVFPTFAGRGGVGVRFTYRL